LRECRPRHRLPDRVVIAHNPLAANRRFPAVPAPHFVRPSAIDRPGRPRQLFLKKAAHRQGVQRPPLSRKRGSMKRDEDCIFCKIVVGQMPCFKLLEDDNTLAFMDIYPANDGHCLVVAKEHYPTLFDISDREWAWRPTVGSAFPRPRITAPKGRRFKAELGCKVWQSRDHCGVSGENPVPPLICDDGVQRSP